MNNPVLLSLFPILLLISTSSKAVNWQVAPTLCISQYLDDVCELNISIQLIDTRQQLHCTLYASHPLACWSDEQRKQFTLEVEQQTPLTLLDQQGQRIHQLQIKRQASKYRRRIRSPWSLF